MYQFVRITRVSKHSSWPSSVRRLLAPYVFPSSSLVVAPIVDAVKDISVVVVVVVICACAAAVVVVVVVDEIAFAAVAAATAAAAVASSCSRRDDPQARHLQQTIQGAARSSSGDATSSNSPKPAKIPITCVRCQITEAREWPNLFLHGPLS